MIIKIRTYKVLVVSTLQYAAATWTGTTTHAVGAMVLEATQWRETTTPTTTATTTNVFRSSGYVRQQLAAASLQLKLFLLVSGQPLPYRSG